MALHKEPYGLVYNDDGSLCVTLRNDDKPFEGVTSFAVERGTTNFFPNGGLEDGTPGESPEGFGWAVGYPANNEYVIHQITEHGYHGQGLYIEVKTKADASGYSYCGIYSPKADTTAGKVWSAQVKYKILEGADYYTDYENSIQFFDSSGAWLGNGLNIVKKRVDLGDGWKLFTVTATAPDNAVKVHFTYRPGALAGKTVKLIADEFQLEQKPFPTSFVDGSRVDGQLRIDIEYLPSEGVISFWYKIDSERDGWYQYILHSWKDTTNIDKAFYWQIIPDSEHTDFVIKYDDGEGLTDVRFSYTEHRHVWRFAVIRYSTTDRLIELFVDGNKINQNVGFKGFAGPYLYFGGVAGDNTHAIKFSNLYIGKAKVGDKLIWHDDYIKQLYQAKRPFSVPPKMPVI